MIDILNLVMLYFIYLQLPWWPNFILFPMLLNVFNLWEGESFIHVYTAISTFIAYIKVYLKHLLYTCTQHLKKQSKAQWTLIQCKPCCRNHLTNSTKMFCLFVNIQSNLYIKGTRKSALYELDLIPSLLVKNWAGNKSSPFASVLGWSCCLCSWFKTKLFPLLLDGMSPCFFWSSSFSLPFWCPTECYVRVRIGIHS